MPSAVPSQGQDGRSCALEMGQVCPPRFGDRVEEGVQTLHPEKGGAPVPSTAGAEWPVWAAIPCSCLTHLNTHQKGSLVNGIVSRGCRGSCSARKASTLGCLATDPTLLVSSPKWGPWSALVHMAGSEGVGGSCEQSRPSEPLSPTSPGSPGQRSQWAGHSHPQHQRKGIAPSGTYTFRNILSSVKQQPYELPWGGCLCDSKWRLGSTQR